MLLHWLFTISNNYKWKTSCAPEPKEQMLFKHGEKKKSLPINSWLINRREESWSWRRRVSHNNTILCSQGWIMPWNSCKPIAMLIIKELLLMDCLHQKATSRAHIMLKSRVHRNCWTYEESEREPSNHSTYTRLNPLKHILSEKKATQKKNIQTVQCAVQRSLSQGKEIFF